MHFYVDESGHTGPNLFDPDQPTLYYGVISCAIDIDKVAERHMAAIRSKLRVDRLHANLLGSGGLMEILPDLMALQRNLEYRFDLYRVKKPDHAVICFFDQVFDAGLNPAMTWTGYWTPMRYVLLFKLALLFDEALAKSAWDARINTNTSAALEQLQTVCRTLLGRVNEIPDARSREIIGDALSWAIKNPGELSYNARNSTDRLAVMPNIVGFQSVMHGITQRVTQTGINGVCQRSCRVTSSCLL